jgi:hypothetical protein
MRPLWEVSEQRRSIHDLLNSSVSAEEAQRSLADPDSLSLDGLKPPTEGAS